MRSQYLSDLGVFFFTMGDFGWGDLASLLAGMAAAIAAAAAWAESVMRLKSLPICFLLSLSFNLSLYRSTWASFIAAS